MILERINILYLDSVLNLKNLTGSLILSVLEEIKSQSCLLAATVFFFLGSFDDSV